jgi:hypothetical protein
VPVALLAGSPAACLFGYEMLAGRAVRRLGGRNPELPYRRRLMPEAVRKRSRANKAQNCFLYCPSSDRGDSAIHLYIDEIEEDFLRSD